MHEGYTSASTEYEHWSIGMMFRDPDFRLDAILLAPNGAHVKAPTCNGDEELSAIAWPQPTEGAWPDARLKWDGDSLALSISGAGIDHTRAAVVLGCRKKVLSDTHKDLSRSWELPATLR